MASGTKLPNYKAAVNILRFTFVIFIYRYLIPVGMKKCKHEPSFPMWYRNIDRDYQRAILPRHCREIFRESCIQYKLSVFTAKSHIGIFTCRNSYIRRKSHFCGREIANREDFCRLLRNETITSASQLHRVTYKFSRPTSAISNSGHRNATLCNDELGDDF